MIIGLLEGLKISHLQNKLITYPSTTKQKSVFFLATLKNIVFIGLLEVLKIFHLKIAMITLWFYKVSDIISTQKTHRRTNTNHKKAISACTNLCVPIHLLLYLILNFILLFLLLQTRLFCEYVLSFVEEIKSNKNIARTGFCPIID